MTITDYDVADAMILYGGNFVQTLGHLFQRGDADNQARVKAAWPEYWAEYRELARLKAAQV